MVKSPPSTLTVLCKAEDVTPGLGMRVDLPGRSPLAVFRVDDGFFVIDDTCTHGEASLCDGYFDGSTVECPLHAGRFCVQTGKALDRPATIAVRTYEASVSDGNVCVVMS
jgi:nitrite reductase/ring-hydroxylating ferredoxin subunit